MSRSPAPAGATPPARHRFARRRAAARLTLTAGQVADLRRVLRMVLTEGTITVPDPRLYRLAGVLAGARVAAAAPAADPIGRDADGAFVVPGLARVEADPHRTDRDARALASRIAADPRGYLPVLVGFNVPGVRDLRPASHARPVVPFASSSPGPAAVGRRVRVA